jgi:hypothetical protein
MPFWRHQCTSASSWPWVTQTSPAPVSRTVRQRSSQSEWSEITRGSSTPFWRARARTRIQPDAKQVTGSGKRRDQRSWIAEGGQITIAPASLPRSAAATFGVSPSGMPSRR